MSKEEVAQEQVAPGAEVPAGYAAPSLDEVVPGHSRLKIGALSILVLAALIYPFVFTMPYQQHILILIYMNALMAIGWNIVGGYAGQVSLGNTIFFGVGAYSSSIMLKNLLISPWAGMLVGIILSILLAVVVGYPCFRLKGHYFAIATIAVAEIISVIIINTDQLGAAVGLTLPILPSSLVNMQFASKTPYYYVILAFLAISMLTVYWIERSRLGYYFRAIREDQDGARALGINPTRYKLIAFILSAVFASMAGTFYAQYVLFIDPPSTVLLNISITMCLMAVLGGVGTLWGPLIGATVLIAISEGTRITMGGSGSAVDLLIYGFLVMAVAVYQPNGLMGLIGSLRRGAK